jgi:hypothetical protein
MMQYVTIQEKSLPLRYFQMISLRNFIKFIADCIWSLQMQKQSLIQALIRDNARMQAAGDTLVAEV